MHIDERTMGSVTVLDVSGQITMGEENTQFKDKVYSLVHQARTRILINLERVTYVDSAGLGGLVAAYTLVSRNGGQIKLLKLTRRIRDLMSITKLSNVFETFDAEQEAVESFDCGVAPAAEATAMSLSRPMQT